MGKSTSCVRQFIKDAKKREYCMVDVWDFSFRELRFDLAPTVLYESIKKKSFTLKKTVNIFFVAIQY